MTAKAVLVCALLGVLSIPGGAHSLECPPPPDGIMLAMQATCTSRTVRVGGGVIGGIVPHHDVAGRMILRFYETLRASGISPKRVVLLSPDHYRAGRGAVTVCGADWETTSGTLPADAAVVEAIVRSGAATRDDRIFVREHGVTTHLPLVRATFPEAAIIPLAIRSSASDLQLLSLRKALEPFVHDRGLVILSMDLSHYKTPANAMREDSRTLSTLIRQDVRALGELDVDSPRGAALFLAIIRDLGGSRSVVLDHTNSGVILDRPQEPCTSYATMLFAK